MPTYPELNGKVAVLSGAAGNLGIAVIRRFHAENVRLILLDRDEDALRGKLRNEGINDNAVTIGVVDLMNKAAVDEFIDKAASGQGGIDILVNIAGGFKPGLPVHEMDENLWDYLLGLNAKTTFLLSAAVARHMIAAKQGGRIVNVAARGGLKGEASMSAYSASKSAVLRLTESMSAELISHGVTVNAVLPSIIDTPPNRSAMPDADFNKWVSPDSLANVIAFLASDSARDITGAALPVYGKI